MAKVLLVDDDPEVLLLLRTVLTLAGHRVLPAVNATEARTLLASNTFELVIADKRLPDGDGEEIADEAIAQGASVLVISGYLLTKRDGARPFEYLAKPVRPTELVAAVERIIAAA